MCLSLGDGDAKKTTVLLHEVRDPDRVTFGQFMPKPYYNSCKR